MAEPLLTVEDVLPIGVVVAGVRHKAFSVRAATVQDNIEAVAEVGMGNPVELSAAMIARQLVSLGSLQRAPAQPLKLKAGEVMPTYIDTELIRRMSVQDYNAIERAVQDVEKKALLGGSALPGGQPAEPSSPATTFPSTTP